MDPQQPVNNYSQTPVQAQVTPLQATTPQKVPFYRSYWIFAAIYLILPPIIGLIILLTGNIFRKKDGVFAPISNREKIALTIIIVVWWAYIILSRI